VLYQRADGSFNVLSDQGDDAGVIHFVERAKLRILENADPPAPPNIS
jgi:hypothetical protein